MKVESKQTVKQKKEKAIVIEGTTPTQKTAGLANQFFKDEEEVE
jgi:hypothetical protein